LVEIDHQVHLLAHGLAHRLKCCNVLGCSLATQAKLESAESALVPQFQCFFRNRLRFFQPKTVAVVRPYGPDRASEQYAEGEIRTLCELIPGRHVKARSSDHRQTFVTDEMKRFSRRIK